MKKNLFNRDGVNQSFYKQVGFISVYRHVMNAAADTFPVVVSIGILIFISYFFSLITLHSNNSSNKELAEQLLILTTNGTQAVQLIIPVLAGFIGMSIADRSGFIVGLVGGVIVLISGQGFLGSLLAGLLAGYSIAGLKRVSQHLPQSIERWKSVLVFPLFGTVVMWFIMMYIMIKPVKWLNHEFMLWLEQLGNNSPLLLGAILGAMMAVDMGGPINKFAYAFGLTMLTVENYVPQAAIMAGGMVPPLGLALATTLFKAKFTAQERKAGKTCYIMGASFITEGAILFAAADPIRVIPGCVLGSAMAGMLSMLWNIELSVPHGGIFVVPIILGNPFLYMAAILSGAVVTALVVGYCKRRNGIYTAGV